MGQGCIQWTRGPLDFEGMSGALSVAVPGLVSLPVRSALLKLSFSQTPCTACVWLHC